jgi:MYXO-CTERM domain-containing protein
MKKTITLLLAAAGMAMGADKVLDLDSSETAKGEYTLSGITGNNFTVAIILDLDTMIQTPASSDSVTLLFSMDGVATRSGTEYDYRAGLSLYENHVMGSYGTSSQWDSAIPKSAITTTASGDYQSLKDVCPWANIQDVTGVSMVMTGGKRSDGKDTINAYVYVMMANGDIVSYKGNKYWSSYVMDRYTALTIGSDFVDSVRVYDYNMTDAETLAEAKAMLGSSNSGGDGNIPEPTTATLSLLALAGLAARRRRK